MNDFDLEAKLKSVPIPERSGEYWNDFPSRVRVQLRRPQPEFVSRSVWHPRLKLAATFALALAFVYIGERFHPLETASRAITKQEHRLRAQIAQIDSGLHILMFNTHGMSYLLAEAN